MKNKKIIISGGAGYLGRALIKKLYQDNEITVVSRDEHKHYLLKKEYPLVNTKVCDIRNFDLLKRLTAGHSIGIWAASLKQIEACDENPEEAKAIILDGAINSRRASIENNLEFAAFISTDKSRAPTTLYGYLKGAAAESFILNAESKTNLASLVYGNVLSSTGSIIPILDLCVKHKRRAILYSEFMTRFMLHIDEAVDLILSSTGENGVHVVPKLKSFRIKDLFDIYADRYGLEYDIGVPRIGEKIHETLACEEEIPRLEYDSHYNRFRLHPKKLAENGKTFELAPEYSSRYFTISREDLEITLENYGILK